jgi:hypothetical protein
MLISLLSFGQGTYKSFIHSGVTKWLYYSPQDACMMEEIDAYGDTVINQLTYKKLWDIHFFPQPPYINVNQQWRDYNQFASLINTFIRQSSDFSKLYLLDGTNNVEYLIVDMNLKVGDEFIFPKLGIGTVVNVSYNNGLKNIHFNMNSQWDGLTFIEGVGLNTDFRSLLTNFGGHPYNYLICYSNSSYFFNTQVCGCIDTKIKEIKTDNYQITRQSDLIEVSFEETAQRTWEVFDIYGRGIQKSSIIDQSAIQIPISGLRSGIYLLRIYNLDNKEYKSLKITI